MAAKGGEVLGGPAEMLVLGTTDAARAVVHGAVDGAVEITQGIALGGKLALSGLVHGSRTCGSAAADEEKARERKLEDPFRSAQRISLRSAQRISFSGCFPHIGLGRQETVILLGQ